MLQHNDLFPSTPCADSPLKADVEHDRVSDLLTVAEVALVVWSYHIIPFPVIYYILTTAGVPSWEGMAAVGSVYPRNILMDGDVSPSSWVNPTIATSSRVLKG